jgi:hypothetical protein
MRNAYVVLFPSTLGNPVMTLQCRRRSSREAHAPRGSAAGSSDGSFLTTLTERSNVLFEGGVYLSEPKLQPFVQIAGRDIDGGSDEHRYGFGGGWYPGGHGNNLKLAYMHIDGGGSFKGDQINLQWQVFTF